MYYWTMYYKKLYNRQRWYYLRRNAERKGILGNTAELISDTVFQESVDISDIKEEDIPYFLKTELKFFHFVHRIKDIHYWRYVILKTRHMDSVLTSEQRERILGKLLETLFQRCPSVRKDAHLYLDLMRTTPVLPYSVSTAGHSISHAFVDYEALDISTFDYPCCYYSDKEMREIARRAAIKASNKRRAALGLRLLKI